MDNNSVNFKWDFFIAHSHGDKVIARELYDCLCKNGSSSFLDQASLLPGEYWDLEIPKAQENSSITIVLISGNIKNAHFAREEVQFGISLARKYPNQHKIIPVYLNDFPDDDSDFYYGLRLIQGISLVQLGTIQKVSDVLYATSQHLKNIKKEDAVEGTDEGHILLSYPTGPYVKPELIPRILIENYSNLIKETEARLVVNEANAFRIEANPGVKYIIALNRITSPEKIPSFDFWLEVFDYARMQGPRMLAALILILPDDQFDNEAKIAREKLLHALKVYH